MMLLSFCRPIIHLIKQAWLFPQFTVIAVKQKRQRIVVTKLEAERLDRLRNSSMRQGRFLGLA